MKKILRDDIQIIKLSPGVPLTSARISVALQRARSNYLYAKFCSGDLFIQVNFARNGDISVSSNIRTPAFVNDLSKKSRQRWTIPLVKSFVYQWMQLSRRIIF